MTNLVSNYAIPTDLVDEIVRAGYYPQLVLGVLDTALAGEPVVASLVQAETTFGDEIRRHLTLMVLTNNRLITAHVDDAEGDVDMDMPASAVATTEAVPLRAIRSVTLSHVVAEPASHLTDDEGDHTVEINLAVGWGSVSRLDLEPAGCGDPTCEMDHGFTGTMLPDDIVLRVATAAEGPAAVARAAAFARALSAATARTV